MGDDLDTGSFTRLIRLGSLAGRVGFSVAGTAIGNTFGAVDLRDARRTRSQVRNALRVAETLGRMKGVPMKIGQMLSLHENLLPPEVARVLSSLQQNAPAVSFARMEAIIRAETGEAFRQVAEVDPNPWAAASIGQLHRARLTDGREVVFKVQYPGIDKVIAADMKNLRGTLRFVFSLLTEMDTGPLWEELNDRLLEELDYAREADNLERTASLLKDEPDIHVPAVIRELSSQHVLCMHYEDCMRPDEACAADAGQELRNRWAASLFRFVMLGLLHWRFLHADPNLANFGFRGDGGLVVFDFGCMKEIPDHLASGYVRLASAVLENDLATAQRTLHEMGVHQLSGEPMPLSMLEDFAAVIRRPFAGERYTFGSEPDLYRRFQKAILNNFEYSRVMTFPRDVVFVDRTLGGHFGNLFRLQAEGPWRGGLLDELALAGRR